MAAFWDMAPCSRIEVDRRFRGVYYLHHWCSQYEPLKRRSVCTRIHSATSQKTVKYVRMVAWKTNLLAAERVGLTPLMSQGAIRHDPEPVPSRLPVRYCLLLPVTAGGAVASHASQLAGLICVSICTQQCVTTVLLFIQISHCINANRLSKLNSLRLSTTIFKQKAGAIHKVILDLQ